MAKHSAIISPQLLKQNMIDKCSSNQRDARNIESATCLQPQYMTNIQLSSNQSRIIQPIEATSKCIFINSRRNL